MAHVVVFIVGVLLDGGEVEDGTALFVVSSGVDLASFVFVFDGVG